MTEMVGGVEGEGGSNKTTETRPKPTRRRSQAKSNDADVLDNLLVDRVKFRHQYDFVQRLMKRLEQTTPKILDIHKHDRGRL